MIQLHNIKFLHRCSGHIHEEFKSFHPQVETVATHDSELPALLERSRTNYSGAADGHGLEPKGTVVLLSRFFDPRSELPPGRVLGAADAGRRAAPGRMVGGGHK